MKIAAVCDRCGEELRQEDFDEKRRLFSVGYRTLFPVDEEHGHVWRYLNLCLPCQKELQHEFYKRGLVHHVDTD